MNGNEMYQNYKQLIRKQASFYSKKWSVDYLEVEGQALEIFVKTLNNYDVQIAAFSTYLMSNLKALDYWCKINVTQHGQESEVEYVPSPHYNPIRFTELKESILTELSEQAIEIVQGVLGGELISCEKNKHLFSASAVSEKLGITIQQSKHYIHEIKQWWNRFKMEAGI